MTFVYETAKDGWVYFVVGPCSWGKDKDAKKAIKIAKGGHASFTGKWRYMLYLAPADITMNGMGDTTTATGLKAIKLGEYK